MRHTKFLIHSSNIDWLGEINPFITPLTPEGQCSGKTVYSNVWDGVKRRKHTKFFIHTLGDVALTNPGHYSGGGGGGERWLLCVHRSNID